MEVVIASSSVDAGISSWDLNTGADLLRYKSCASPPHGLVSVGQRFLASSQIKESKSTSGSVLFWSWEKPQPEVKSFPVEPIKPLVSNTEGTYIIGGGSSGNLYLWEVASGKLLRKWHGHYRAVTCLVLSDDDSLLVSGSEDGSVRVWSFFMIFDDVRSQEANHLYEHSFSEHSLSVTSVVCGYGGGNAIIVSSSEDRTCKVWSLSEGRLLRNIVFPSIIDAVALDPGEHVFYAGGRDGKIYIAALGAGNKSSSGYGPHIVGSLPDHSKAVSCLAFSMDGIRLVSGSEDGMIRVWDTKTRNIVRIWKHTKGPVNNLIIVKQQTCSIRRPVMNSQASTRKHAPYLPPPLDKYVKSMDEGSEYKTVINPSASCNRPSDALYFSSQTIINQIKELKQKGSAAASDMEIERLKFDCKKSMQMVEQWKKMYENLHQFCVKELLDGEQGGVRENPDG